MSDVEPPYPPAPLPEPVPAPQRFPSWKQALVMLLGGLALAVSACFGCLFATLGAGNRTNSALEGLGIFLGIVAFAGLIGALVGVVLVLMRMVRALFGKKDQASS
jgi:TRAP-type C4-dicarboxylate transport system permease small subunit